jgi:hypothetical protein
MTTKKTPQSFDNARYFKPERKRLLNSTKNHLTVGIDHDVRV